MGDNGKSALALHHVAGRFRRGAGQFLERRLIDEINLHIARVLPGDGIRLYDNPGGVPIRPHGLGKGDPAAVVSARYRPVTPRGRRPPLGNLNG
ncbi:hypothetical protein OG292_23445 [Streptomyces sp. NBC_01511]|uniref:hypothetical protein n=1 Tax=Streptomyces sp. NBC_01511 TaxID=2903889 RepID=UPI003867DD44